MSKFGIYVKQWIRALLFALISVVLIKSFFFWVYVVPSSSMEKTLLPGDLIFVNKMSYGLRLPITPLTFPLSHYKMPFNNQVNSFWDIVQLPYVRFFAKKIERNDVVVFNYPRTTDLPIDHRPFYIKRCIGLPGDTLQLKNRTVFINETSLANPKDVEFNYSLQSQINLTNDTLLQYDITEGGRYGKEGFWQLTLSDSAKSNLEKLDYISSIEPIKVDPLRYVDYIFPFHEHYAWNVDYFGPVVVPKKGVTVNLDTNNINLYREIIEQYEGNELICKASEFLINGQETSTYTFKMDYYFMMGDNRHNSSDSRFWGFLPEDHIVGKATRVLLSINKSKIAPHKYRWSRFFKEIE